MIKALFLFAGLGGYAYPFYQSGEYDITFVEIDKTITPHLQAKYPLANVVCGDAIDFLEKNFVNFDFIFASPPCVANSRINCLRVAQNNQHKRLPSLMSLEIKIFLDYYYKGNYIIENTIPYYKRLISWTYTQVGRHSIYSNFLIPDNKSVGQNEKILLTMGKNKQAYKDRKYTTTAKWYIITNKDGVSVAIQCKKYNSSVGNGAVQEIISGKLYYHTDYAAVISTSDYTKAAVNLAYEANVVLLDYTEIDDLEELLLNGRKDLFS